MFPYPPLSVVIYAVFTGLWVNWGKMGKEKNTTRVILNDTSKVILYSISKVVLKWINTGKRTIRVILHSTSKVILSNTTKMILFGRIYKGTVVSPGFLVSPALLPRFRNIRFIPSNSMGLK